MELNAIELLKSDHVRMRALLAELVSTSTRSTSRRPELLAEVERELTIHARLEEEIFYPALLRVREKGEDDAMYYEALEEHRAAEDLVLPDLKKTDPATEQFSGRAKVLKELIEHHAREEEEEMFPRARELLSAPQLLELGAAMGRLKADLMPGPAPKGLATGAKVLLGSVLTALDSTPHAPAKKASAPRKSTPRAAAKSRGAR